MAMKFYHWQDSQGPGRNLTGTTIQRLQQILFACLVTGYGDKPGAGWELVHSVPTGFSLRNGPMSGIFNISDAGTTYYRGWPIVLFESIIDDSSPIPTGENARSGYNVPGVGEYQRINFHLALSELDNLRWLVLADEKTFVVHISSRDIDFTSNALSNQRAGLLYVGEDSEGNFLCVGGQVAGVNSTHGYFASGSTQLRDPNTGLVFPGDSLAIEFSSSNRNSSGAAWSDNIGHVHFYPEAMAYEGTAFSYLRGVLSPVWYQALNDTPNLVALGVDPVSDNVGKPFLVGNRSLAVVCAVPHYSLHYYLTDDPAYSYD